MKELKLSTLDRIRNKIIFPAAVLFVLAECVSGVLAQCTDGLVWSASSFSSIVLVAVFFLLFMEATPSYIFTQLALVFTVAADYFLVLHNAKQKLAAMLCFSFVQIFYFARIHLELRSGKLRKIHIGVRIFVLLVTFGVTLFVLGKSADALAVISMLYYAMLLMNIVFSFMLKPHFSALSVGLLLFILCDTFVGLGFIENYFRVEKGSLLYFLANPPLNMAWIFYTPSQTLLGLSLFRQRLKRLK